MDSLKQVLAIKPGNPDAHFNIGVSMMELGRVKEAEASIRKALAHKSDNPNYHFQLALAVPQDCEFNRTQAAKALDINIRTLRNKLNEYKAAGEVVDS